MSRSGPMDRAPGRIGFMSTQRRAIRWQRLSSTCLAATLEISFPALIVPPMRALANGGTAPPSFKAWLATNSLQLDYRFVCLGRLTYKDVRRGSPPPGAAASPATGFVTIDRSSRSLFPSPPGCARLPRPLPQVPAASSRRAERYDGKRDLYLQHAA